MAPGPSDVTGSPSGGPRGLPHYNVRETQTAWETRTVTNEKAQCSAFIIKLGVISNVRVLFAKDRELKV